MVQPAIRTVWRSEDSNVEIIRELSSSVTFHRGMGDSGRRFELVEKDCPRCHYDRMFRMTRVNPVDRDRVEYWCTNPVCSHYAGNTHGYLRGIKADQPTIWSQTAWCPDCDEEHTITLNRETLDPDRWCNDEHTRDDSETRLWEALCNDCQANRAEQRAGV